MSEVECVSSRACEGQGRTEAGCSRDELQAEEEEVGTIGYAQLRVHSLSLSCGCVSDAERARYARGTLTSEWAHGPEWRLS